MGRLPDLNYWRRRQRMTTMIPLLLADRRVENANGPFFWLVLGEFLYDVDDVVMVDASDDVGWWHDLHCSVS